MERTHNNQTPTRRTASTKGNTAGPKNKRPSDTRPSGGSGRGGRPPRKGGGFTHESGKSGNDEWYTPKWFFTALGEDFKFDIDVCSPGLGKTHVPAARCFTIEDDGLAQNWGNARVYCNPPYSALGPWMAKLAEHGNGIGLVFARTDPRWWHDSVLGTNSPADAVCLTRGRIRFERPDGTTGNSPAAGSAIVAFGAECAAAVAGCGLGTTIYPRLGHLIATRGVEHEETLRYVRRIFGRTLGSPASVAIPPVTGTSQS